MRLVDESKSPGRHFLVSLSAAGFGTLAILGRTAYADGMDAPTILFLRFAPAAVVLTRYELRR